MSDVIVEITETPPVNVTVEEEDQTLSIALVAPPSVVEIAVPGPEGPEGPPGGAGAVDSVDGRVGTVTLSDLYKPLAYVPAWTDVTGKPSVFPPDTHNHDDRYYTETESDALYSVLGHNHDDRYFTETESDARYLQSVPSTYATDAEVASEIATHEAASDPHTGYQKESEKGSANGYASLGADGKVPNAQLSALALTDVYVVASQAAQLALTAEEGDIAIRTDQNRSYAHNGGTAGTMADWNELLTPTDTVLSVDGRIGAVTLSDLYAALSHAARHKGDGADPIANATTSVSGLESAADKTKLDGVETGATADQTAAEILTAVKTVDGSGSGLDADTLDGIDSAGFAATGDTRIPTQGENDALVGTSGTPSTSNKYVTDADSRNTNSRTPTAHKTSHEPGGTDAMTVDAAAATGSLRTLGTGATQALPGNHASTTDARTPTSHASTHKGDGSDPIANATTSVAGLMSAADKTKLDSFELTPKAKVTRIANLSVNDITWTAVPWTTESYDASNWHDNATNNDRISPGVAGDYLVTIFTLWDQTGVGVRAHALDINGTRDTVVAALPSSITLGEQVTTMQFSLASATDYIRVQVYQSSAAPLNLRSTSYALLRRLTK